MGNFKQEQHGRGIESKSEDEELNKNNMEGELKVSPRTRNLTRTTWIEGELKVSPRTRNLTRTTWKGN